MFTLAEFVVEQTLRDALEELRSDVQIGDAIEDVFGRLLDDNLKVKYGQKQLDDLILYLKNSQISVVSAFPGSGGGATQLPQISITMQENPEAEDMATIGDWPEGEEEQIEPAVILTSFTANSYEANTGFVRVPDGVNLASVRYNHYYVDGSGNEYQILFPVSDENGDKRFTIAKDQEDVNLTGGKIVSAINVRLFLTNTIPSRETILIGIHTENSTLTKLVYHLVKYLLYKKKTLLASKECQLTQFHGSDYNQLIQLLPDNVYSRFITMSFVSYNKYRISELPVFDSASSVVRVEKDEFDRDPDLDQTVETTED